MDQLDKRFQISQWVAEDFAGVISEKRKALLEEWRQESPENEKEYQELWEDVRSGREVPFEQKQKIELAWQRFSSRNLRRTVSFKRWMSYAAVLFLMLGIAGIVRWQMNRPVEEIIPQEVQMAQGNVMLILSNGSQVEIGKDSIQVLKEEVQAKIQVTGHTISYIQEKKSQGEEAYNTLIIPRGGEYQIVLADGSRIWLNAETEFRYPVHFTGDRRQVYLKGEACFEVAKQTDKPFIVTTSGGVDVRVLGTCFNVASYEDEANVVTTLASGSVEVSIAGEAIRIKPDEQLLFNKSSRSFTRRQVDAETYLAWKDGKFIFDDQPLECIVRQLQRWYEMDVVYTDESIQKYRFSGDLKKYDDFGKIIRMIEEVAGLKVNIKNKHVIIGAK